MDWYTIEQALVVRANVQDLAGLRDFPILIRFATGRSIGTAIIYAEYVPSLDPRGTSQLTMPLENGSVVTISEQGGVRRVKYLEKINGEFCENFAGIYIGNARRCLSQPNGQGRMTDEPGIVSIGQLS